MFLYKVELNVNMNMDNQWVRIWKRVVVVYFKVQCKSLPGETGENYGKPQYHQYYYQYLNQVPPSFLTMPCSKPMISICYARRLLRSLLGVSFKREREREVT
jgi:hypothetical protein